MTPAMCRTQHPASGVAASVSVIQGLLVALLLGALAVPASGQSDRVVITAQPGYSMTWDGNNGGYSSTEPGVGPSDNLALATQGTVAFGSSEVGLGVHFIYNVNDGWYGNSSSWIPDFVVLKDPDPFIGLNFGSAVAISSVAWSRDNGDATEPACSGTCTDRAVGRYTLQVTRVASPDATTAETGDVATGWVTIGTVEYRTGTDSVDFSAYLRHRFELAANGSPIQATGLRIKVSSNQMDIDEIEVNPEPDPVPPITDFIVLESADPYTLSWDRNDGMFYDPNTPAQAPLNRALASEGTAAFGSSEYGAGVHFITNVIDGLYGNNHCWIPKFTAPADPNPFIGLNFGALIVLQNVCWSRDNGDTAEPDCGGTCTDRALGLFTVQITRVASPGVDTPETGDAANGWATLGTIHYKSAGEPFTPYLRHRFDLGTTNGAAVQATGLRLKVPDSTCAIDEIEINVSLGLELGLTVLQPAPRYTISWDGNDGDFHNPSAGARAPNNDALAASGASAFASSELGFGIHFATKVNDGLYGNSSSWISANGLGESVDPDPFIGVRFGKPIAISSIAYGRDNGDTTEAGCGGTCTDRWAGVNTLQITTVSNPGVDTYETEDPATGWITLGTIEFTAAAAPTFNPHLRHRFDVAQDGQPIQATALRIKIGDGRTDFDEIEVNPAAEAMPPPIADLLVITSAAGYSIAWDGNDGEFNNPAAGAGPPDSLALPTHGTAAFASSEDGGGVHGATKVIDGLYGDSHCWVPKSTTPADTNPSVGLSFGRLIGVRTIAWGRDNGDITETPCNTCTDRALGTYTLQLTRLANPGAGTPETGDPDTGWVTLGTLEYKGGYATLFNPHLRHRYTVSAGGLPIGATGLRIRVSANTMAIDEIEVNPVVDPDQNVLVITPQPDSGYAIAWDGNDGDFNVAAPGAAAPQNAALSANGATAFASSQLDADGYRASHVNDGLYGDRHGWVANVAEGADADPFIGVRFGKAVAIRDVAFGRDNGDDTELTPAGPCVHQALGTYTLQVTTMTDPGVDTAETEDPTTGWATVGSLLYRGVSSAGFRHYLRHSYAVSKDHRPIDATALRIKVPVSSNPTNQIVIDELEIDSDVTIVRPQPVMTLERSGNEWILSWSGTGVLQGADEVTGAWANVPGATTSPQTVWITAKRKFYRVAQ